MIFIGYDLIGKESLKVDLERKKKMEGDTPSDEESIESSLTGTQRSSVSHSIILPEELETCFRNLEKVTRFAIDIGGSLTKIAYFSTVSHKRIKYGDPQAGSEFSFDIQETPRLHFIKFETDLIHQALDFIQNHALANGILRHNLKATGEVGIYTIYMYMS